ncbi:hypothetical protein MCEMZLE22_01430 [actinobacterium SCGC AAA044-D11]
MKKGTATSYYECVPEKISLPTRINLLRKIDYWKIVPLLKLMNSRRYKREAALLIESGLIQTLRNGIPVRYVISKKVASFDISPDQGKSYLNYLRGNLEFSFEENLVNIVNSIATIEARIKTKAYKIY